jgi:putative methylase
MQSKKQLAVALSRLHVFDRPSARLEQYPTDSEVAAEMLWFAFQRGELEGKTIGDFGCGTGILGIGALMLGARKVYFVDIDEIPLKRLDENLKLCALQGNYEIFHQDISEFNKPVDVVIENPPFGVKTEHADRKFLTKAFQLSPLIYSLHKIESFNFIVKLSSDSGFKVTHNLRFDFPLKGTMDFHTKRIRRISVGCYRIERA